MSDNKREYQKCPVCDGTGLVSRPPEVAGDQESWISTSTGPWQCNVCSGVGIIERPSNVRVEMNPRFVINFDENRNETH